MEQARLGAVTPPEERRAPAWFNVIGLLVSAAAGVVAFLPFAFDTSPWDAVTLRVPGNQGNWWHALVGAPFFLAFPMIWLRLRALFSERLSTSTGRRLLWIAAGLSIVGTMAVESVEPNEVPFPIPPRWDKRTATPGCPLPRLRNRDR